MSYDMNEIKSQATLMKQEIHNKIDTIKTQHISKVQSK